MTGLGFNTSFRVDFGATVALLPSNGSWILFICYRIVPYSSLNGESWLGAKVWYLSLGSLSEASDIYMALRVHSWWSLGLRVTLIFCSGLLIVSLHWDLMLKARWPLLTDHLRLVNALTLLYWTHVQRHLQTSKTRFYKLPAAAKLFPGLK